MFRQKFILLLALLLFFISGVYAESKYHTIEKNKKSSIDWTEKSIISTGKTFFSLYNVINHHQSTTAAINDAKKEFIKTIISIFIDSESSIKIAMQYNETLMNQIINILPQKNKIVIPPITKKGSTTVTLKTILYGPNSFLSMISYFYPIKKVFPATFNRVNHVIDYSGVVIDCRIHTNFRPAIGLKIYSENGEIVYSPAFTKKQYFIQKGHVTYFSKPIANLIKKTVGDNFLYLIPKALKGSNNSGIVLYDEDIDKLISSQKTRNNLKECKVVIIVKSFKNKI